MIFFIRFHPPLMKRFVLRHKIWMNGTALPRISLFPNAERPLISNHRSLNILNILPIGDSCTVETSWPDFTVGIDDNKVLQKVGKEGEALWDY